MTKDQMDKALDDLERAIAAGSYTVRGALTCAATVGIGYMAAQYRNAAAVAAQALNAVSNETQAPTIGVTVVNPVSVTGVPGESVAAPPEIAAATAASGGKTTPRNVSVSDKGNSTNSP